MVSSARACNDCGIARPSAVAVLALITSSNLAGCSTGPSRGLAPRRSLKDCAFAAFDGDDLTRGRGKPAASLSVARSTLVRGLEAPGLNDQGQELDLSGTLSPRDPPDLH